MGKGGPRPGSARADCPGLLEQTRRNTADSTLLDGAARIRTGYAQSKAKRQRGVSLQVGTTDPTPGRKKEGDRERGRERVRVPEGLSR